jgi:hypothetical protein
VDTLKEQLCYVATDYEAEMQKAADSSKLEKLEKTYDMPDGQVVTVGIERFRCPEVLFKPSLMGMDGVDGVHKLVHKSIMRCDVDLHAGDHGLYCNIVLSGGTTMYHDFDVRLQREISALAPSREVKISAQRVRKYNAWRGGSILADSPAFELHWTTKQEYDEARRCTTATSTACTRIQQQQQDDDRTLTFVQRQDIGFCEAIEASREEITKEFRRKRIPEGDLAFYSANYIQDALTHGSSQLSRGTSIANAQVRVQQIERKFNQMAAEDAVEELKRTSTPVQADATLLQRQQSTELASQNAQLEIRRHIEERVQEHEEDVAIMHAMAQVPEHQRELGQFRNKLSRHLTNSLRQRQMDGAFPDNPGDDVSEIPEQIPPQLWAPAEGRAHRGGRRKAPTQSSRVN